MKYTIDLDDYERDNLLWLLNEAARPGVTMRDGSPASFNTGDWLHQIRYKLKPENGLGKPNMEPSK